MKKLFTVLVVSLLALPSLLFAAGEGSLNTTSTGSLVITGTVAEIVQITDLDDIALSPNPWIGTGDMTGDDGVCVYSNDPLGEYEITVTSANGSFQLEGDATADTVVYSLAFTDAEGTPNVVDPITYNTITAADFVGDTVDYDCGGTPNATLSVTVAAAALEGALADTYTDTVTIVVSPNS